MDHLATTAPRMATSGRAYVRLRNGSRALIVPPGAEGSRICVRVIDADGRQSDTIEHVPVEDVSLEDLPAPEPLAIGTSCVGCGSVADGLKCPDCGAAFCSRECFKREWKGHKRACRESQARAFGEAWARMESRGYDFVWLAILGRCNS